MIKTGTYIGNGAATQAVAGVGFLSTHILILRETDNTNNQGTKTPIENPGGACSSWRSAGLYQYSQDDIISLDADGFTVGDGTPAGTNIFNVLGVTYTYVCMRS